MFHLDRGITLIELLVALAIVAVLSIVAVPSFIDYIRTNRLTAAAQQLYYTLQYARSEAEKRNVPVYVSFQSGSDWCYGVNAGSTCNCATASCGLGATKNNDSAQSLSLSTTGLISNAVKFESTHGATYKASTLTFTITGGTTAISIVVSLLGNLKICSNQVSGYQTCT